MTKRNRSDSVAAAKQAAKNAAAAILQPPGYVSLPEAVKPFYGAVIKNRPRDRWNDADLALAVELATCEYDAQRLRAEVAIEGDLVGDKVNPKHALINTMVRRAVMLARMLHVHAEATTGQSQRQGMQVELEQAARRVADNPLIPRLQAVQ